MSRVYLWRLRFGSRRQHLAALSNQQIVSCMAWLIVTRPRNKDAAVELHTVLVEMQIRRLAFKKRRRRYQCSVIHVCVPNFRTLFVRLTTQMPTYPQIHVPKDYEFLNTTNEMKCNAVVTFLAVCSCPLFTITGRIVGLIFTNYGSNDVSAQGGFFSSSARYKWRHLWNNYANKPPPLKVGVNSQLQAKTPKYNKTNEIKAQLPQR